MKEKLEADYDEAFSKGLWQDDEAACYFLNLNPKIVIEIDRHVHRGSRSLKVIEAQTLLGIIRTWPKITHHQTPFWYVNEAIKRRPPYVKLEILLDKIKTIFFRYSISDQHSFSKKYEYIAKELNFNAVDEKLSCSKANTSTDLPSYLDNTHPNFSIELYIVVMAWQSLYGDENTVLPNIGVETRVTKWLKEAKFETHGKEVVKRIATVITPNHMKIKRGTNPTIQSKNK